MSGAEIALIIGNVATLITAIGGFLALWRKTDAVKADVVEVKAHVNKVAEATNGMKDELVREVRSASFKAGVKSEKDKKPPQER